MRSRGNKAQCVLQFTVVLFICDNYTDEFLLTGSRGLCIFSVLFSVQTCTTPLHPYADGILIVSESGGWVEQEQPDGGKLCAMAGRTLVRSPDSSFSTSAV